MIVQEKQVFKFDCNLEKSTGHGPTQAVHVCRDRSEKVTVGEEFAEVYSDEEAIEEETRQAWEPAGFIPKKCRHRSKQVKLLWEESTQKKFSTKPVTTKEQKNSKKCKPSEEGNEEMETGGIAETNDERINNLPNHVAQRKKKLQEAADVIQGLRHPTQSSQAAQSEQPTQPAQTAQPAQSEQPTQISNPEVEKYRVPNPPPSSY